MKRSLTSAGLGISVALFCAQPAMAESKSTAAKLQRATQLVDDYYGDRQGLEKAALLVREVLAEDDQSARAYVEAARITIKGGHIVSRRFEPGTVDLSQAFIDRALAIEPNNVAAISLKAHAFLIGRDLASASRTLQQGLALSPSYPWFHLDLAAYYRDIRDYQSAVAHYEVVIARGRGTDTDQRRAYPAALAGISRIYGIPEHLVKLRDWAAKADEARNPKDAWTLGEFAEVFADMGAFDDALKYSRKAIAVMNYGRGRRTLAMALYGKAAQVSKDGQDGARFLSEAMTITDDAADIADWFGDAQPTVAALLPVLQRLLLEAKRGKPPPPKPAPRS